MSTSFREDVASSPEEVMRHADQRAPKYVGDLPRHLRRSPLTPFPVLRRGPAPSS